MNTAVLTGAASARVDQTGTRHETVAGYTGRLAWPLIVQGESVLLPTSLGIVGVAMTAGLAGEVNTVVRQLDHTVPVITIPGRPIRWVFRVNAPGNEHKVLPAHVSALARQHRIPLPPTMMDTEPVRWITPPDSSSYLAELDDVLMAVRRVTGLRGL